MIASGVRFASFGFIGAPFSGPYAFIGRSMGCAPLAVIHPGAKGRMPTHSITYTRCDLHIIETRKLTTRGSGDEFQMAAASMFQDVPPLIRR